MNFELVFQEVFLKDVERYKKSGQNKLLLKIEMFISEIGENPRKGTGKPEQLKFFKYETWSRRINKQHRLSYQIEGNVVYLLSAWGHYNDK